MSLQIKTVLLDGAKMPKKAHETDFCFDVYAHSVKEVSKDVYMYGLGIKIEIDVDPDFLLEFDVAMDLRPRSSIYKTGMLMVNSPGTIDLEYRGECKAVFYHVMKDLPIYEVGDRVGQVKISVAPKCFFNKVDSLDENTQRGTKGHGSTGK